MQTSQISTFTLAPGFYLNDDLRENTKMCIFVKLEKFYKHPINQSKYINL